MVFVLVDAPEEGGLGLFLALVGLDDVAPVAAEHGVRLATAGLPVSQDSYIKAFLGIAYDRLDAAEDFPLRALSMKDGV